MKIFLLSQMGLNEMLIALFAVVGFTSIFTYFPQIITLARSKRSPESISITTWGIWVFECLVGFVYALFVLQDIPAIGVAFIDLAGCTTIFGLTFYMRYIKFADVTAANLALIKEQ